MINYYIVKNDSAYDGKGCVVVKKLNNRFIEDIFNAQITLNFLTFGFGDEVYTYEKITKEEYNDRKTELKRIWNLFSSPSLESAYEESLIEQYKNRKTKR